MVRGAPWLIGSHPTLRVQTKVSEPPTGKAQHINRNIGFEDTRLRSTAEASCAIVQYKQNALAKLQYQPIVLHLNLRVQPVRNGSPKKFTLGRGMAVGEKKRGENRTTSTNIEEGGKSPTI